MVFFILYICDFPEWTGDFTLNFFPTMCVPNWLCTLFISVSYVLIDDKMFDFCFSITV